MIRRVCYNHAAQIQFAGVATRAEAQMFNSNAN